MPASGHQDHTTLPYAAAFSSGSTTIEPDAAASIASRAQRAMTIAIRPSVGRETAGLLKLICPTRLGKNAAVNRAKRAGAGRRRFVAQIGSRMILERAEGAAEHLREREDGM